MKLAWLLWMTSMLPQPLADQTCLATTVYLEARSESTIGQFAVAEVALRRRERGYYGKTVCDVVRAPRQFALSTTPTSFQVTNLKAFTKAWKIAGESMAIWKLPKTERVMVVPGADHFATTSISPKWATRAPLRTIGEHAFYAAN
ncbi:MULTISPECIES: cell wall hydrolase [Oleiagrimonas]|uniref:Cell wall hydrolase n=1 Tax=Oleiagrimonas citrea TaxID=1665687 RepID=A0A846ZIX1_9GAMM|nr:MULTISPECIES: cell wall hydrolase [Oleiagrimonas]NKZ37528.1 cell wall hydrolase [Oleiagrimonas citrea]RAP58022.1 cell wall hydrolase [Oleiagrimonas sp. MCCC 1A03011]